MVRLRPKLANLKAFGTDGEKCVFEAFATTFGNANHLLCSIHAKDNIIRKCAKLGIDSNQYVEEIFGKEIGDTKIKGLMDCMCTSEFNELYERLRKIWVDRPNGEAFAVYMDNFKKAEIKKSMMCSTRKNCGLGDPPKDYTQNGNESVNSLLKRSKGPGKLTMKETIKLIQEKYKIKKKK